MNTSRALAVPAACLVLLACGCAGSRQSVVAGTSSASVAIDAAPTPAWIFVDGEYVGRTPVESSIPFTHATRYVEVVAVPLYAVQTRQVLRLVPPSLPRNVQFFLDNQDPGAVTR